MFDRTSHSATATTTAVLSLDTTECEWIFLVAEAPYDVVIGLDMIKAFLLHLDPRDLTLYVPRYLEGGAAGSGDSPSHDSGSIGLAFVRGPVDYPFIPERIKGLPRDVK